jgi:hypothetical protein
MYATRHCRELRKGSSKIISVIAALSRYDVIFIGRAGAPTRIRGIQAGGSLAGNVRSGSGRVHHRRRSFRSQVSAGCQPGRFDFADACAAASSQVPSSGGSDGRAAGGLMLARPKPE